MTGPIQLNGNSRGSLAMLAGERRHSCNTCILAFKVSTTSSDVYASFAMVSQWVNLKEPLENPMQCAG